MKARQWICRIGLFILVSFLVACGQKNETGKELKRAQVQESTNGQDYNLEVLSNENDSHIISFNGPSDAVALKVRVYRLASDGWELMASKIMKKADNDDRLSGVFEMETSDDHEVNIILENADEKIVYSTGKIFLDHEIIEKDKIFLAQSRKVSIKKEIPLGLIIYSSKLGIGDFSLDDFYEFKKLEDLDLVQAISFEFLTK